MLDAAQHSIETGHYDEARTIISTAVERHRTTIRELRDLSFALEPVVLRDQGFGPAVRALAEQVGTAHELRLDLDVEAAEELGQTTQVALYTIIRELLEQSIRRGPPNQIGVRIWRTEDGGVKVCVADDAEPERRRRSLEAIEERVRQLHCAVAVDDGGNGGNEVNVALPAYVARR